MIISIRNPRIIYNKSKRKNARVLKKNIQKDPLQ